MLLELHIPFVIIDSLARFEDYRVLILPDEIPVGPSLAARLNACATGRGSLIASYHAGLGEGGGCVGFRASACRG